VSHKKPRGASLHTLVVHEVDGQFCQYAGAGMHPVAVYDRERSVLEAARHVGLMLKDETVRVIFVIPTVPSL
jgi:hypothetical protein